MTDDLAALEAKVGHPGDKYEDLLARIEAQGIQEFSEVQHDWLDLMWTLDAYRIKSIAPRDMGDSTNPDERLNAVYRKKGDWFAHVLAALLENQTTQVIAPKIRVRGFSQRHQIDLAWPEREEDPLICAETKVTGAPAYKKYPDRGAMSDFSNRRKELKFASTDLKLARRDRKTAIRHWGAWREQATPRTYFLWAARLRRGKTKQLRSGHIRVTSKDYISTLVNESVTLVNTYLDGAGLFAWQLNEQGTAYEAVPLPEGAQVSELDDVLDRIASEISELEGPGKRPPPPVIPDDRAVPEEALPEDEVDEP